MQFAIIAKFLPYNSSAYGETFQLPYSFLKSPPPPPLPLPSFSFNSFQTFSRAAPEPSAPSRTLRFCLHRRRPPEEPTACATTALPLRCRVPLPSSASLHSTEPYNEPELPLSHPIVRPCCALLPDPALPPAYASILVARLIFHHGSYLRSPSLQAQGPVQYP